MSVLSESEVLVMFVTADDGVLVMFVTTDGEVLFMFVTADGEVLVTFVTADDVDPARKCSRRAQKGLKCESGKINGRIKISDSHIFKIIFKGKYKLKFFNIPGNAFVTVCIL